MDVLFRCLQFLKQKTIKVAENEPLLINESESEPSLKDTEPL